MAQLSFDFDRPEPSRRGPDITGQRFGRWNALRRGEDHRTPNGTIKPMWWCRCDCGTERLVQSPDLRSGRSQSCGCFRIDEGRRRAKGNRDTAEWKVWCWMRQRCFDPKHKNYALYGGRGITVCERWLTFENFYADMGPRPTPKHTIDRFPDKDGPYAPDNCRWATWTEQQNNRSNNRHVLV